MLLQRLRDYGAHMDDLPPPMYLRTPVRYVIMLDHDGGLEGMIDRKSSENKHGPLMEVPNLKKTSGIKPTLLVNNAEYVLGLGRLDSKPDRVRAQHAAFVELVRLCAEATQDASVQAVLTFLTEYRDKLHLPPDFEPSENIAFEVGGIDPTRAQAVRDFWASKASTGDAEMVMQCLVCGQMRPPVARLPISIKGIPGGQTSGMALISANANAFESYGLEASLIAPTCEDCGQRFGNALNRLLSQPDTCLRVGPVAYVFWTEGSPTISLGSLLSQPEPQDVEVFLTSPWRGKPEATQMDVKPFYAAALSASGARVVVRDWLETTLVQAKNHLQRYFRLQRLRDWRGEVRYLALRQLARATINSKSKHEEPAPQVVETLFHLALHGGELPKGILYQVVRRIRSEQQVSHAHAALIKMVLLSQQSDEGSDVMIGLDPNNQAPAYLCGRLLAVLEDLQRAALGDVNSTITSRYYGTASSAPASVFARLLRGARPHLDVLHRDKPGLFFTIDRQLQEILGGLASFPPTLELQQQGLFALGYYHQRGARGAAKAEGAAS